MTTDNRLSRTDLLILSAISLALLFYHLLTSILGHYGYFIDEVYYIACSDRLEWGYVDHPPLSIALLTLNRAILGDSLPAIRFLPACALAATVFLTGLMTHRLGGSRASIVLSALAVIAMPVYLLMGSFYSMNAYEILMCTGLVFLVVRMVQDDRPKDWLIIGVLLGLGLEMKHTMALYVLAIGAGMLLTPVGRILWNKWFFWGMLVSFLLILPNLLWQMANGFPSLEFYRNAMVNKNIPTGPLEVVVRQIVFGNPLAFPLWCAGLAALLFLKSLRPMRFLGFAYVFLLLVLIVSQSSRPDRIAALYPVLFAAGAVAIQAITRPTAKRLVTGLTGAMLVLGAGTAAPAFTPLLSPPIAREYLVAIGLSLSVESGKMNDPLPQWLGDRLGWRELAENVARVYRALPAEEQRSAVIVSTNYGEAGAMEVYGRALGLPPVYATHNSFHTWGPPPDSAAAYIGVFVDRPGLERIFESVVEAGVQECEYCTGPQQRIPIYVARGPRISIAKEWEKFRIYN